MHDRDLRYSMRRPSFDPAPDPGDGGIALRYFAMLIPTIVASLAFSSVVLLTGDAVLPRPRTWAGGVALNVIPPAIAGAVIHFALARRYARRALPRTSRHLVRAAPLYLAAGAFMYFVIRHWSEPGFGLVAQLFVWPAFAFAAAIPAEAVTWRLCAAASRTNPESSLPRVTAV